jgi:ankyrin repeat protein
MNKKPPVPPGRGTRHVPITPVRLALLFCASFAAGCIPPSVVQYTAFHNRDFPPRSKPAEVQTRSTSDLLNGGYLLIGYIDLRRNVRTCYEDGRCTDHSPKLPSPDNLQQEAAQRGADIVTVLEEKTVLEKNDRSDCTSTRVSVTFVNGKPVTTTTCASYVTVQGNLEAKISRALVWRFEPEAARSDSNARAIEAALKTMESAAAPDSTSGNSGGTSFFGSVVALFRRDDKAAAASDADALSRTILVAINANDSATLNRLAREEKIRNWRDDKGRTALMAALLAGRNGAARTLLAIDPGLGTHDKEGHSAMHYAAARADLATVQEFAKAGFDLHAKSDRGASLLHLAVLNQHDDVFDWLLKRGLDVRVRDMDNETLLHLASSYGRPATVTRLINLGLDVDDHGGRYGRTPLMIAAGAGNRATLDVLLKARVRVDLLDNDGNTPLHYAAGGGDREVIRTFLRDHGSVNVENKRGASPLLSAMARDQWEAATYLLDRGASFTSGKLSVEDVAAHLVSKDQVTLLRRYVAAYPTLRELLRRDPRWILHAARTSGEATVAYLVELGARVNRADPDGWTPLTVAANAGNAESTKALLNLRADPTVRNGDNKTALMLATLRGHSKVVEALRTKGALE